MLTIIFNKGKYYVSDNHINSFIDRTLDFFTDYVDLLNTISNEQNLLRFDYMVGAFPISIFSKQMYTITARLGVNINYINPFETGFPRITFNYDD